MAVPERERKYKEKSIKRIPLDVLKNDYEIIKDQATQHSETVNGYIKTAIWRRMKADGVDLSTLKSRRNND